MSGEIESTDEPAGPQSELLDDRLYDYQRIVARVKACAFFQVPIGVGGRTPEDTNMFLPAVLPSGVSFIARSLEIAFIPRSDRSESDRKKAYLAMGESGELVVQILDKLYHQGSPLGGFMRPWEGRLVPWTYGPMLWSLPLSILPGQKFAVSVEWRDGAPFPGRIGVVLHGMRQRNIV